jgi:transposase-like protein
MRREAEIKVEILWLVERSPLSVRQTLRELEIAPSTYYRWRRRYRARGSSVGGQEGMEQAGR